MAEEGKTIEAAATPADAAPLPPDQTHPEGINVKPPTAETPAAPATSAPLDNLLSEFEKANPRQEAAANNDPLRLAEPLTQEHAILNYLTAIEQDRLAARDRADFEVAIQQASNAVADAKHLPPDYARMRMEQWARNEYASNSEFQQAWENRYSDPQAAQLVTKTVNKAISNLKKEVQKMPPPIDLEATADKAAVAAAVRGTGGKAPEEPKKNYGSMNDGEFKRELAKFGL